MPLSKLPKLLGLSFFNHQVEITDTVTAEFHHSRICTFTHVLKFTCHPKSILGVLLQHSRGMSPAELQQDVALLSVSALVV